MPAKSTKPAPAPPDEGFVQVNIRLDVRQHRALKLLGAMRGHTLAETVGELAIDAADREGFSAKLDDAGVI